MDRYTGLTEMSEAEAVALALARDEWERDQAAVAEYEVWFLSKTIMEADAEALSAR